MSLFIKLPLIKYWSSCFQSKEGRPILAKEGILVNLDKTACIKPHSEVLTVVDGHSIPCSLEQIQRAWEAFAKPISSHAPGEPPIPYDPYWEGRFEHQILK